MPPARLAPLLRSTGRCLALRQKPPAVATVAATSLNTALCSRVAPNAASRVTAFGAARGYADGVTTRSGDSADETHGRAQQAEAASLLHASLSSSAGEENAQFASQQPQYEPQQELQDEAGFASANQEALRHLDLLSRGLAPFDVEVDGHKFGLTTATTRPQAPADLASEDGGDGTVGLPLPQTRKLQDRYDPVTTQLTRLLMRDGKLAKAQRDMAMILNYLRTSPPPKLSPARPLLPGHPPAAQLPLDPVRYLTLILDSVAPLIKVRQFAGMAGGGRALPVPFPLAARQRRRAAFMWLLEVVEKKPSRGSGRTMFAHRIGEELVAVAEGRSSVWDRRELMHKQGTTARANVKSIRK